MSGDVSQRQFAQALLSAEMQVPPGLTDPQGRPAPARFSVYRNNVTASLTRVLQAGFPVVEALVGAEFFRAMVLEFLRQHPPKTRLMMLYGAEFAEFLQDFAPVAQLPYLPDVARLEQSIRESYHTADASPINPARLAGLTPEALLSARLTLAPSLRHIASPYPILSIWQMNRGGGPLASREAQNVVVLRSDFDPEPHLLHPADAPLLRGIARGMTLSAAIDAAPSEADLVRLLTLLLTQHAVLDIE